MTTSSTKPAASNEGFVLCLPGQKLDVSLIINKKKFRNRGGRDGAMAAMRKLDEDGLGKLIMRKSKGSIRVSRVIAILFIIIDMGFVKTEVPTDQDGKLKLAQSLMYGVSLIENIGSE